MFRFVFRIGLSLLLFLLRRHVAGGARRTLFDSPQRDARSIPADPEAPRATGTSKVGAGAPPLDRSDVVDVPFTEIPPPSDPAAGAAGRP